MSARRCPSWLVGAGVIALCLALSQPVVAAPAYKVIVHPDNPVTSVEAGFLRNVYLKKATDWSTGLTIRPIDLAGRSSARAQFAEHVLKKTLAQLRNYWNQRLFSGKGVPPPQVDSPAAAIAYVLANPGAIAYVPADVEAGRAKVIQVR